MVFIALFTSALSVKSLIVTVSWLKCRYTVLPAFDSIMYITLTGEFQFVGAWILFCTHLESNTFWYVLMYTQINATSNISLCSKDVPRSYIWDGVQLERHTFTIVIICPDPVITSSREQQFGSNLLSFSGTEIVHQRQSFFLMKMAS